MQISHRWYYKQFCVLTKNKLIFTISFENNVPKMHFGELVHKRRTRIINAVNAIFKKNTLITIFIWIKTYEKPVQSLMMQLVTVVMIAFHVSWIAFDDTDDVGDDVGGDDGDHSPAPRPRLAGPLFAQAQLLGEESNPRRASPAPRPCRLRLEGRAATSRR